MYKRQDTPSETERVLAAAVLETAKLLKPLREELLGHVSKQIVKYANRFGMSQLTEATLRANLNLSLVKGGESTSYSKVTDGEKLRLKVATILALIQVGEEQQYGRYPGILFIDSPGNNELVLKDLDELISGLAGIAKEFPFLQIVVASTASPAVLNHLPAAHTLRARDGDPVW